MHVQCPCSWCYLFQQPSTKAASNHIIPRKKTQHLRQNSDPQRSFSKKRYNHDGYLDNRRESDVFSHYTVTEATKFNQFWNFGQVVTHQSYTAKAVPPAYTYDATTQAQAQAQENVNRSILLCLCLCLRRGVVRVNRDDASIRTSASTRRLCLRRTALQVGFLCLCLCLCLCRQASVFNDNHNHTKPLDSNFVSLTRFYEEEVI